MGCKVVVVVVTSVLIAPSNNVFRFLNRLDNGSEEGRNAIWNFSVATVLLLFPFFERTALLRKMAKKKTNKKQMGSNERKFQGF